MKFLQKNRKVTALLLAVLALAAVPDLAHAAEQGFFNIPENPRNIGLDDVVRILVKLIQFGMIFAASIAVIFTVVNGYQYIFSAGNPEKVEKAKQGLTWSIGGFILAISSFAIVLLLQETLKSRAKISEAPGIGGALQGAPRDVEKILINIADLLLVFGATAAIIFLIFGGYRYMTSQGNRDLVDNARRTIMYSLIGLIVLFLSYSIVVLVIQTFNP